MASTLGFEPGPHWWEASALTTAPPLLPVQTYLKLTSSSFWLVYRGGRRGRGSKSPVPRTLHSRLLPLLSAMSCMPNIVLPHTLNMLNRKSMQGKQFYKMWPGPLVTEVHERCISWSRYRLCL